MFEIHPGSSMRRFETIEDKFDTNSKNTQYVSGMYHLWDEISIDLLANEERTSTREGGQIYPT